MPSSSDDRLFGRHGLVRRLLRPPYYRFRQGLTDARRSVRETFARIHPAPVFVLGMQKSGTTAIAALLSERTGLGCTLDLRHEIDDPALPQVRAGTMTFDRFLNRNRLDFSRAIVKEPNLTPFYPRLAERFPEASFVFIVRDPRDTIRSILDRLGMPGDLAPYPPDNLDRFPQMTETWKVVLDGRWLGLEGDHVIDLLAARWNSYADLYRRHQAGLTLVRYEDFLTDKVAVIDGLAETLHLAPRHSIDDLLDHPFQPAGDRSVSWAAFYGERNLARIEDRCRTGMQQLGYEPSLS